MSAYIAQLAEKRLSFSGGSKRSLEIVQIELCPRQILGKFDGQAR